MEKSEVGRQAIEQLETMGVRPILDLSTIDRDGNRAEQKGRKITVYMQNISSTRIAAQTVIHEATHVYYDIGKCQWAEAVCMAKEKMHLMGRAYLTVAEKRYIIKLVKDNYNDLNWKRGRYRYGRPFRWKFK